MNNLQEIYDLKFSCLVTPYNLVDNAKLSNYYYVKFYSGTSGLICELKCEVDNIDTIFYYHFDMDDKLQKIYKDEELVFDRETELNIEIEKYYESK